MENNKTNNQSNQLPVGWEVKKLSDVVDVNKSSISKADKLDFVNYLDTGSLTEGRIEYIQKLYINQDKIPSRCKRKVNIGDVLYSTVRPNQKHYGYLSKIYENMIVSTGFCVVSPKNTEAHNKFIYYYLTQNYITEQLHSIAEQSKATYPSINPSDLTDLIINLPPLDEQKEIAAVLSSLDDKIELNQQINKKLEEMAQAIFRQWFIDFNFPDENGNPYRDSGGTMIDSEFGQIPAGWSVGKLGEEFNIIMGQSPAGSSYNEIQKGTIFFQGRTDFGSRFPSIRLFTTEPKRIARKFDILLSVRAPVGDLNIALSECCIGRGLAAISTENKSYCYYKLQALHEQFNIYNGTGTVFGAINKEQLHGLKVILPSGEIIKKFESFVSKLDERIYDNHLEILNLQISRDTLLPKLMSGEIRL